MFTSIAAFLAVLGEALIILSLLAWIVYDFLKLAGSTKGADSFSNYIFNFISSALGIAVKFLAAAESQLGPIVNAFRTAVNNQKGPISSAIDADIRGMIINAFNAVEKAVTLGKTSEPGDAVKTGAAAMSEAFAFGLESFAVTAAFEACFPEKLNVLNGVGPMLAQLSGFDEVGKALREPLFRNAFGQAAEYYYRSVFKPELPDEFDAVLWHGRGLLTDDQLRNIFEFSGLKPEYENAFIQSGYRAVQPRALATAIQDTPFPTDEMRSLLKFNGYRPADIELMLQAFEGASTRNVRNQYLSAVTTAAERGTLTPAEVDSALADLNFSAQAKHWVQLTIATRKLEQLAELYRKSISEDYKYNLITEAQYVPSLEAIGIAQADANAHFAVDSAVKHGRELAAAAREAAREAAAVTRAQVKAAIANYQAHNIDEIALAAALAVAGLPAGIIPWAVDVAALRRQSSLRMVFGKLVTANDAVLLREQVAAIKEQVIKKLLDIAPARAALESFGVPPTNAQDLVATWAAQALKTVLPVQ